MLNKPMIIVPVLIITAALLSASNPAFVKVYREKQIQTGSGIVKTDSLYKKRFPGGAEAFIKFIAKNIHYPRVAQEQKITGAVTAQFRLSPDGTIKDVTIIKAPREDMGQELVRILNMLPKFDAAPGKTKTILFTVAFFIEDENGKHMADDLSKLKVDLEIIGYGVRYKEQ